MTAAEWIGVATGAAGVILGIAAWLRAGRAARAAERSADAAERSAGAGERSAQAAEESVEVAREREEARLMSERTARIEFRGASATSSASGCHIDCRIANVGRVAAHNIGAVLRIDGVGYPAAGSIPQMPTGGGHPEQRLRFGVPRDALGTPENIPDFELMVEWTDDSGRQVKTYGYPFT